MQPGKKSDPSYIFVDGKWKNSLFVHVNLCLYFSLKLEFLLSEGIFPYFTDLYYILYWEYVGTSAHYENRIWGAWEWV